MIQKPRRDPNVRIPVVMDVERVIDGHPMMRCSYYAIQSDQPMPDWSINAGDTNASMLLLNLEAILIGSPESPTHFRNSSDVELMYDFVENQEALFVDINDIWIPKKWFGRSDIKQGQVFRVSQKCFSACWQFRNDNISCEELFDQAQIEKLKEDEVIYSPDESVVFNNWTQQQIEQSKDIYQSNRKDYLTKIKE